MKSNLRFFCCLKVCCCFAFLLVGALHHSASATRKRNLRAENYSLWDRPEMVRHSSAIQQQNSKDSLDAAVQGR